MNHANAAAAAVVAANTGLSLDAGAGTASSLDGGSSDGRSLDDARQISSGTRPMGSSGAMPGRVALPELKPLDDLLGRLGRQVDAYTRRALQPITLHSKHYTVKYKSLTLKSKSLNPKP